ncbi:VOC family protein [Streptosporangium longisporum]|uniref:VOC domain-containing protein n=1 Tax=Streptosporangium longisporum TaxID=46187 RepID=A0ABP6K6G9_9ACTN
MTLTLDVITLGVPEVRSAGRFYATALSCAVTGDRDDGDDSDAGDAGDVGDPVNLDLHGTGRLALSATGRLAAEPAAPGFRGYLLTYVLDRPAEVRALMDAAVRGGAEVLKPARKALFGSFSGVFRAPDGSVWKPVAATGKDTGSAAERPLPTETTLILGVSAPKASKAFYEALGMTADRDYGNKYIDFHPARAAARLCLMERGVLAKDAGITEGGGGLSSTVLTHAAGSRQEVDALLASAAAAGGRITGGAAETAGGYSGSFSDPDGFLWKVTY